MRVWTSALKQRSIAGLARDAIPVAAVLLYVVLKRVQLVNGDDWATFSHIFAFVFVAALPLLMAHLAGVALRPLAAAASWLAVVIGWPTASRALNLDVPSLFDTEWALASVVSAVTLLLARRRRNEGPGVLDRLPVTLDRVVMILLSLWAVGMTSLFIATPDPLNNQPLVTIFDGARLIGKPGLTLGYLVQFFIIASLIGLYLWTCRHVLVRHVLAKHGWIIFLFAAVALWVLVTPAIGSAMLLLPLNSGEITLLPSEDRNAFSPLNYRVAMYVGVGYILISLASERLLAERREAKSLHASARAELDMLHQQINPHFLFNTLNTLYALCLSDREASAQAVVKLSDLLRYSVYDARAQWVPLDGEIAQLENYLDLQMLRFGKRCDVTTSWPDTSSGWRVPPQAMIMLVENAFKHGVEESREACSIDISLTLEEGRMTFVCRNSPSAEATGDGGLGLANLERRLELLLGDTYELESGPDGDGWRALLALDLRPC